ncbi:MAG TPA: tRNA (adenosine(37)-N6)-threonylcarbamoyltransferase complex dimerization subunit type 1 TsaB [Acholeplasmataceae bacterium]|nr:tRNA (adenosine(37)-N6)-threonylcarbamoyltransferase complex dimerization subunit type 1 TsaB [Acholeplasmataceae bacterium]
MKKLILDTSTNLLYVGLLNNEVKDSITRVGSNDNAAYIVNCIDQLLKRNNLTLDDIKTIIVGIGPGSYTGLRASLAVAKMLSYTKKITLKKISSLLLLSSGYHNEYITASIDARRGFSFAGTYHNGLEIKADKYIKTEELGKDYIVLNDETIKVDLSVVSCKAMIVEDVSTIEPNYLRITEAERNNDQKS